MGFRAHGTWGKPETEAADVVMHEGELELDLLWTATSDDSCIMVSGSFHNSNE